MAKNLQKELCRAHVKYPYMGINVMEFNEEKEFAFSKDFSSFIFPSFLKNWNNLALFLGEKKLFKKIIFIRRYYSIFHLKNYTSTVHNKYIGTLLISLKSCANKMLISIG